MKRSLVLLSLFLAAGALLVSCNGGNGPSQPDTEIDCANEIDDDGDGLVDCEDPDCSTDDDEDGYSECQGDCNDENPAVNPGAAAEGCDGADTDCDGVIPESETDDDGDGVAECEGDCDDTDAAVNPGASEVCNGIDDDCDTLIDADDPSVTGTATWYLDADGDTYGTDVAGPDNPKIQCDQPAGYVLDSTDCNDSNENVNPGASELCSTTGVDDDCDGLVDEPGASDGTLYYTDGDGDGYGDAADAGQTYCSDPGAGYSLTNDDCDDTNAAVNPGAQEVCNAIDDDCDELIDTDDPSLSSTFLFYDDTDGDGYGAGAVVYFCDAGPHAGYADNNTDCDDTNVAINPGATEICNGLDDDCDTLIDDADPSLVATTWYQDQDGDGFGTDTPGPNDTKVQCDQPQNFVDVAGDCVDSGNGASGIYPGADEGCDGIDTDCDGVIPATETDDDGDGVAECAGDCDDTNPAATNSQTYFQDADGDGFGDAAVSQVACGQPAGYVSNSTDCNDASATVYPGATEACNGIDDDCSGSVPANEDDKDGDGYRICQGDCNDTNNATGFSINPGALEVCDANADEDCDGLVNCADTGSCPTCTTCGNGGKKCQANQACNNNPCP